MKTTPIALFALSLVAGCMSPYYNALLALQGASAVASSSQQQQQQPQQSTAMQPAGAPQSMVVRQNGTPPPVVAQGSNGVPPPVVAARVSAYVGNTPVRLVNATAARICGAYLAPQEATGSADEWLGGVVIEPGASHEFRVQASKFNLRLMSCAGAALIDEREVDFFGPREVVVHTGQGARGAAPSGFRRISFVSTVR